jgi:hypothetical protein
MEITINNIVYTLREEQGKCEVEFFCADTGLVRVLCFDNFPAFNFEQRRVETMITQYDITPTGMRINRFEFRYTLPPQDFTDFENSIGVVMKKAIMNGIFRNVLKNTYAVYNSDLAIIPSENQPIPIPE